MIKRGIDLTNPGVMSRLLNTLILHTPVAYRILDRDFRVQFVNDHFLELFKVDRKTMLGNLCYNITNNGIPCAPCPVRESFMRGTNRSISRKDIQPDGSSTYFDDFAIPLRREDGSFDLVLELAINNTNEMVLRDNNNQVLASLVASLVAMLEKKDSYTSNHSHNVTAIGVKLGRYLGLDDSLLFDLKLGALLHDIGKIYIEDDILNKPGLLERDELAVIQRHPLESHAMLDKLSRFARINLMTRHHHERWDGEGYPAGLAGDTIPLGARIISIADAYDAMTSDRPYRPACGHLEALREITGCAGSQFDPALASQFAAMTAELYPSREAMLSEERSGTSQRMHARHIEYERRLPPTMRQSTRVTYDREIIARIPDVSFAREIFRNTPCFYTMLDEDGRVLLTSLTLARALNLENHNLGRLAGAGFEALKLRDFRYPDKSEDPVATALRTGKPAKLPMELAVGGEVFYCDVLAAPVVIGDSEGEKFTCIMEIVVDRTPERSERRALENDIKNLLTLLYRLVTGFGSNTGARAAEIVRECAAFGEYLNRMEKIVSELR